MRIQQCTLSDGSEGVVVAQVQAHLVLLVHSDVDNDRLWVAMLQHAAQVRFCWICYAQ